MNRAIGRAAIAGALLLLVTSCSKKKLGESCDSDDDECVAGYTCFRGVCSTLKQRVDGLNEQSGVGSAPIERPVVGGERVRVRTTNGEGTIFAACAATERLIGGGCRGGADCGSESGCAYLRSFPDNFTGDDTVGARWICAGAAGTLYAYALCQETAPATVTAVDAGVSD